MAKAPDPKKVAAALAAEEAARVAAEVRQARERMVMWVFIDGERRVLRQVDTTARQVRQLRDECGMSMNELWVPLLGMSDCPLDVIVAAWWLAGLQAGVEGETYDGLLDRSFADAPWLHYPTEEEVASDGVGDDSPPD